MSLEELPLRPGVRLEPPAPTALPGRAEIQLTVDLVDHQLDQLFLPRHVGVERHRADAELGGPPPHRERLEAVRTRHRDAGLDDAAYREPAPGRRLLRSAPQQAKQSNGV